MKGTPARPEVDFKVGGVRVAVWMNTRLARNGRLFDTHQVVVERTYRDGQGDFKTTGTLETNDIPKAILALKRAYEYLTIRIDKRDEPKAEDLRDVCNPSRIP